MSTDWFKDWPPHIWIGTSVENQHWADKRIPRLLEIPAEVRFLSCEPLLEPIQLAAYLPVQTIGGVELENWVNWVIVGGESGAHARPFQQAWAESLLKECLDSDTPFFMKQFGVNAFNKEQRLSFSKKGEDINEFPLHLQVREFPRAMV